MTVDERPRPLEVETAADSSVGADAPPTSAIHPIRRPLEPGSGLLLFGLALFWFGLTLDRTFHMTDEGYLLRLGHRMAQGEVPHRDFVEDYGPGAIAVLGALVRGGDGEILFVRQAIAVWKALAVVLGFCVARLLVPLPVAFGVGLLGIVYWGRASMNVNAPHAALFTIPLCLAAAGLLAWALQREGDAPSRRGLVAAGVVAGLAVFFKQNIGVMNAYGLSLAVAAVPLAGLEARPREGAGASRTGWLIAWAVAAALLFVPGARFLGVAEYLVHIAPIHALMACVAVALVRQPSGPSLVAFVQSRALPFAIGGLVPVVLVALFYLVSGHLDDLLVGMFERPLRRRNYAIPAMTPGASIATFAIGASGVIAGAFLISARRAPRAARATAGLGILLMALAVLVVPHANPRLYTAAVLTRSASLFDWVIHTGIVLGAVAVFGPRIARGEPDPAERARLRALLPIAFFSALLCYQVFPRGAHNAWFAQPVWMPLLAIVLYEPWRRFAPGASTAQRSAMAVLLLIVPIWLAWPVALRTWRLRDAPARALALPRTEGLTVKRADIERGHLGDVEALVAALAAVPSAPLLLIGGDAMLHHVTGRPPLRPEHDYAIYNTVLDMLPLRELAGLEDGGWIPALRAQPETVVVVVDDDAGRRVRRALPRLDAHLRAHYAPIARFGVYEVWRLR